MRVVISAVAATLSLSACDAALHTSTDLETVEIMTEIESMPQTQTIRGAAPNLPLAPPRAVDHVVVMSGTTFAVRPDDDRFVVTRSGDWIRVDRGSDGRSVGYSNIAAGISIDITRDETGRLSHLGASRHPADDTFHVFTRVRTGERDTHLGETCEIWRSTFNRETSSPIWLSCVTGDGVELWSRVLYSNGGIMESAQAIAVERRPVRADEVRPPADAFDWGSWTSGLAETPDAPNDEVTLASPQEDSVAMVIRRRAGWTYRAGWIFSNPDIQSIDLTHEAGGLYLGYRADSDGPLSLLIGRFIEGEGIGPLVATEVAETVLGERCIWSGWVGRPECRTSDGLVLWVRIVPHRVSGSVERKATDIRRGGVTAADMQPPSQAFTWLQ